MTDQSTSYHAVLMGDIVSSEAATAPDVVHEVFNDVVAAQNAQHAETIVSPLTITLGDEFQGLITSLSAAMLIMRDMRFALMERGVACRFALGLVDLKTKVNTERAWNMMGVGLGRTRDKLEQKKSGMLYRFSIPHETVTEALLEAVGAGLASIEEDWTDQQAENIVAQLRGAKPADLAKARGVSVQAIYKVRSAGKYETYMTQWRAIALTLADIDRKRGLT